jgi:acetyl esterase/lipase
VVTFSDPRYVHKRSRRGALGVWRQWNTTLQDSLSIERHISPDCSPVFLVNCVDDPVVKYQNSELLDSALTANSVPHRYIQYQTGGHGFGASTVKGTDESRQWKNEFIQWISNLNQ